MLRGLSTVAELLVNYALQFWFMPIISSFPFLQFFCSFASYSLMESGRGLLSQPFGMCILLVNMWYVSVVYAPLALFALSFMIAVICFQHSIIESASVCSVLHKGCLHIHSESIKPLIVHC